MLVVTPPSYGGDALFTKALMEEVMPQVERNYHASKDRTQRAIAGASMGGAEALLAALDHLDQFAWIGSLVSQRIAKDLLKSNGVQFADVGTAGAHMFLVFRRNLAEFVTLLFRPSSN